MTKTLTKVIVVAVCLALIVYDIIIVLEPSPGDTISEVIKAWANRIHFIPLATGVLMGHLFWNVRASYISYKMARIWVLAAIGALSLTVDMLSLFHVQPVLPLVVGVLLGRLLWPQRYTDR